MFEKEIAILLAKPEETIEEHNNKLFEASNRLKQLNYIDDNIKKKLDKTIYYHDLGKMNEKFQTRLQDEKRFNKNQEIGHNILSYFLMLILEEEDELLYHELYSVLNHHHYVDNLKVIEEKYDLIYDEVKRIASRIDKKVYKAKIKDDSEAAISEFVSIKRNEEEKKKLILIKGLLHKCDYSASAGLPIEYPPNFLEKSLDDMMSRWIEEANDTAQTPQWNEMQKFCRDQQDSNLVITAQTGMGKTEAALLWIGEAKGFFILPLRTAINAIYRRVRDEVLQNENIEARIALIHGDMMSIYRSHIRSTRESQDKAFTEEEYDLIDYYNKSRNFSYPLNISTPDQLFDFVFAYPGYELKLAMLSYSKVVIDEIQAYNPDLLAYIILGIQKIHKIGGKFAIFTATLPPFVKDLLQKTSRNKDVNIDLKYKEKVFINDMKRHHIKVLEEELSLEDVIRIHTANIESNKSSKCLIVCNTVKKAQEIYEQLKEEHGSFIVNLLHSKFTKKDRRVKEEAIQKSGDTDYIFQEIWIATQIVEASLDIDFDYLFTELSDLTGFFQRLGRINRKGVKSAAEINAYVYTEISPRILIHGDRGFIDKGIYSLSKKALLDFKEGILNESDKNKLINKYLTTENLREEESGFIAEYWDYYDYVSKLQDNDTPHMQVDNRFRNIISFSIIPLEVIQGEDKQRIELILDGFVEIDRAYKEARDKKQKLTKEKKRKLYLKRSDLKEKLEQYVVQIGQYDLYKINIDKEWTSRIPERLNIKVVDCEYSFEKGFSKGVLEENKSITVEEKKDEFTNFF